LLYFAVVCEKISLIGMEVEDYCGTSVKADTPQEKRIGSCPPESAHPKGRSKVSFNRSLGLN